MTLLIALLLAADPGPSHQVSIPLDDYEKLRRQSERPALTVVDLLRVEGSFAGRDLAVVLTGRASGAWPTAEVLQAEGVRLHSCEGEALLSRTESGGFALTPLAQRFRLRCRVALDGSDRLAAQATGAVLEVASAVTDGELVASGGGAERAFSVVRRIAGAEAQDLPPAVTGRYLVTLLPDEARFAYRLEVRNPARGHRRFEVALRDAEHVEAVEAQVPWDAEGGRYRFDLPPGESVLTLTGRLTEARFTPPVAASLQYLLLESHPLIRPDLTTAARRVGVGETGLEARFRGAQAFLLASQPGKPGQPGAEVAWTATRLEALKTAGLALHELRQVFFLEAGAGGAARGEATLSLDNQGSPALTLPGLSQPTFASVGGEPAFLTHDKDGSLFLPLAQGPQEVVVQASQPFAQWMGLGLARLQLPRPGVPASRATVELRYPAEWLPLYEELAPRSRLHLLRAGEVAWLLVLALLAERLLFLGGLGRGRRLALAGALALVGAFHPGLRTAALLLAGLAWAALGAALIVRRLRGVARAWALAGVGGAALLALLVAGLGLLADVDRHAPTSPQQYPVASNMLREAPAPAAKARLTKDEAEVAQDAAGGRQGEPADYEGLPARIELPPGARQTVFTRELLATDAGRPVVAVLVSARLVALAGWAAALLLAAAALLWRRDLAAAPAAVRRRLEAPPPAA